jgi:hypothetical protein
MTIGKVNYLIITNKFHFKSFFDKLLNEMVFEKEILALNRPNEEKK